MRDLQRLCLYAAVVLTPFQDTILGSTPLGFVGANLSSIPILLCAIIGMICWFRERRYQVSVSAVAWAAYAAVLSIAYVAIWGPESHGFSVVYKTLSMGLTCLLCAYSIFYVDVSPTMGLRRSVQLAFALLIVGVLVCDVGIAGGGFANSSLLHITPDQGGGRWRSFSAEPSMFSATVVSLGLVGAHLSTGRLSRSLTLLVTFALLIVSQSKGALVVVALSGLIILFLNRPSVLRGVGYIAASLVVAVPMAILVWRNLTVVDLAQSTSTFATRGSMAVWSAIVIAHNPLGVGFSGLYQAITIYLPAAMDWVRQVSPVPLNFVEVGEYVNGTNVPLDAKCFLLEYTVNLGMPFLVAYIVFWKRVSSALRARRQTILLVATVFLLVSFATYVNALALYAAYFALALAYREYRVWRQQLRSSADTEQLGAPLPQSS
jgi:hypothetical protein